MLVLGAALTCGGGGGGGVKLLLAVVGAVEGALVVAGASDFDSTIQIAIPAIARITQPIISFANGCR